MDKKIKKPKYHKFCKLQELNDAGELFDKLSILEIKGIYAKNNTSILNKAANYFENLLLQLGDDIFLDVYNSKEYDKLFEANDDIFIAIEKLENKRYEMLAESLHELNKIRFKAKKKLQEHFFGELEEVKV